MAVISTKKGNTVNDELEKSNFDFAGKTLAEVWSSMVIDGYPVVAEYIKPEDSEGNPDSLHSKTIHWRNQHVRQSQYFTQIVKCFDPHCCQKPRSSYFALIPDRFLPPPVPLRQTSDGLRAPDLGSVEEARFPSVFLLRSLHESVLPRTATSFRILPYDAYCPSVHTILLRRTCKKCWLYHASLTAQKMHQRQCGVPDEPVRVRPLRLAARRQRELMAVIAFGETEDVEWLDEDDVDCTGKWKSNSYSAQCMCFSVKIGVSIIARINYYGR